MHIAMIDHSYHETTKSTRFFSEILEELGTVRYFHDDSWRGGIKGWKEDFDESDYDLIVIWQIHEAFAALSGKHDNVVFVSMYDAMLKGSGFYWKRSFGTAKCLSFSRKLHEEITHRGGNSHYFKYFPDPAKYRTVSDFSNIRAFFWYRSEDIGADVISELCAGTKIANLAIHNIPDPGHPPLSSPRFPSNISRVEFSTWFADAEAYRAALLNSNVFFSPRLREGIGMASLEAMASGLCVAAPNFPTMNEYIANGTNGILYSPAQGSQLDFSRAREIGARARETVERGFVDWRSQLDRLKEFLATPKSRLQRADRRSIPAPVECVNSSRAPQHKISVVTVCLNAAATLQATMDSVLAQALPNLEYVVFDGGSKDSSVAIIEQYSRRLAYWQSEPDKGVYHAMNNALDHCTGDWIVFIHAGDTFAGRDSLIRMLRYAPEDADIVYGHHYDVPVGGIPEYHPAADFEMTWSRLEAAELSFDWLAGIPALQATAVRRDLLSRLRFDTRFRLTADHELLFRARRGGARFFNCDETISACAAGRISAKNYALRKQEWALIGRSYADAATADHLYVLLEKAEAQELRFDARRWLGKSFTRGEKYGS